MEEKGGFFSPVPFREMLESTQGSAGCGESRMSGAGRGAEKHTDDSSVMRSAPTFI